MHTMKMVSPKLQRLVAENQRQKTHHFGRRLARVYRQQARQW
jgi:hypothetical protein